MGGAVTRPELTGATPKVPIKWEDEAFNNNFVELAADFWSCSWKHKPGTQKIMPIINNKQYAFKVKGEDGSEELLLYGTPGKGEFNDVEPTQVAKEFAASLGLPIKRILAQGGGHVLFLQDWLAAFPEAKLYIPADRIAQYTPAGRAAIAKYGRDRIIDLPKRGFPELNGIVEFYQFQGLRIHVDIPMPKEGGKPFSITNMPSRSVMKPVDPHDEVFCFHAATGLMIGGDNVMWYYPKGAKVPFLFKMQGNKAGCICCTPNDLMAIGDKEQVDKDAAHILSKDFDQYVGFHELPGSACTVDAKAYLRHAMRKVKWTG
eukprot:CAMPEP_0172004416 /NCGR_PEP_ID=MMETSP1041-20130122/4459_1 /TAXON_ID=464988 /ORGANISM="Hemiselmis andersenii, Strain CCMP439" /LENGTH=316 /DNA_ID=CAMNT_0012658257 /DNA_START=61 /DNA_END=1011 /DNA_ORIENTATION=-